MMGCAPSSSITPLEKEIDYSLIEDDLPRIDKLLQNLREQEDYADREFLNEKLGLLIDGLYTPSSSGDSEEFLQFSNYLAENGYPALYTKIFHQCHNFDILGLKNEKDKFGLIGCYMATEVLYNTCDSSVRMCRDVGKAGIIKLMLGELRELKEYANATERDEYKDLYLEMLLATLHNIIKLYNGNRRYFRNAGAVKLLEQYLQMKSVVYRSYALLILSYIAKYSNCVCCRLPDLPPDADDY
ncbi:uncharacterized protein LOC144439066 [Glandiceps talaboti]